MESKAGFFEFYLNSISLVFNSVLFFCHVLYSFADHTTSTRVKLFIIS